ncbi:hypothetical protein [Parachlamydia sp.]|uniref:hypothetical protein n=1 Tax=Parachlamydia sp. TaxID=2052048 RepID=UPI003D09FDFF
MNITSARQNSSRLFPIMLPQVFPRHVSGSRILELLRPYNPRLKKIECLMKTTQLNNLPAVPLERDWEENTKVYIKQASKSDSSFGDTHYFVGGLPALMQAARKTEKIAEEEVKEKVVYVNDGLVPKSLQSGHQAHVHPSEWPCYNLPELLAGFGPKMLPKRNPANLKAYSYLKFSFEEAKHAPFKVACLYGHFAKQFLKRKLTDARGISAEDRWLCAAVVESLDYHEALSKRILAHQGQPSFSRTGRVYWSPNHEGMQNKKRLWNELGIDCEFASADEVMRETFLKQNSGLQVLKIPQDGKFYPETPRRIASYLEENYPHIFSTYQANLKALYLEGSGAPCKVLEESLDRKMRKIAIKSFFGSLGHNQVFKYSSTTPLWREVPVTGNSVLWECSIDKHELAQRFGQDTISEEKFAELMNGILPAANLSNLHLTMWKGDISDTCVLFYVRASQGAHFNDLVANKDDLENMCRNIEAYCIGKWTMISAGSCSRKTDVSNVPEFVELSSDLNRPATFIHGLSGIGYSFSAASFETLKNKPKVSFKEVVQNLYSGRR